jgi:hypothetical protein
MFLVLVPTVQRHSQDAGDVGPVVIGSKQPEHDELAVAQRLDQSRRPAGVVARSGSPPAGAGGSPGRALVWFSA